MISDSSGTRIFILAGRGPGSILLAGLAGSPLASGMSVPSEILTIEALRTDSFRHVSEGESNG